MCSLMMLTSIPEINILGFKGIPHPLCLMCRSDLIAISSTNAVKNEFFGYNVLSHQTS